VTRAFQYTAGTGAEREDMTRVSEVLRPRARIDRGSYGLRSIMRRDTRG
jgi:hypothetical protein